VVPFGRGEVRLSDGVRYVALVVQGRVDTTAVLGGSDEAFVDTLGILLSSTGSDREAWRWRLGRGHEDVDSR